MKARWIALLALLISASATACMGYLENTEIVAGGVLCTYRLSNNDRVQMMYPGRYSCPFCLE